MGLLTSVAILGLLAWVVTVIAILAGSPNRNWLAAAIERVDSRLLDRLNTLLFLEKRPRHPQTAAFSVRIAKQTHAVLAAKPSPPPFSGSHPLPYLFAFLAALAVTLFVGNYYAPWKRLVATQKLSKTEPPQDHQPLELAPPATNNAEQKQNWGEVRITDPGTDLKVTKVDVVPLQIEAAANAALKRVAWFSTINGAEETNHDLPPPTEPRYVLYQPTIYLDELRLQDWDVMTYYAKANTEKSNSFASDIYFLEVRPFREDILKMPGGENGKAYQTLADLSALISRQQQVIRQTHQHIQKPPEQENVRVQDRTKLSEAEGDVRDSADHLYAKMAAEMENKPIGEALDNLAKSSKSLDQASTLIKNNVMQEAPNRERNALSELIAARKIFQKAVSENPKAFEDSNEDESPVADASKRLNQMAEFRNEAKAAQQFVQKTGEQQRSLERRAKSQNPNAYPKLADEERGLEKSFEDFLQEHPQAFKDSDAESQASREAMAKAADSLQNKARNASADAQQASEDLEKLAQGMIAHSATQQLADAYKLKQLLDQQSQTLGQFAQGTNNISDADLQKTADAARETINQLKHVAEQEPTRDAFGDPLRDALSGTNKVELDAKLDRLQQDSDNRSQKQHVAGQARDGLEQVSKAFASSEPRAMQMARNSDPLKAGGEQDSFGTGMAELDSLIKQSEKSRPISREDQAKQGQEALYNLQLGIRSQYGNNDRGNQIMLSLEQALKANTLEVEDLKKLMDQLQHFSVETTDHFAKKDDKPEVTNIDPTRLPPAYRGRIQKYFQKLSEK